MSDEDDRRHARLRLPPVRTVALLALSVLVLLAVAFDRPPQIRGPAPYPPEWQWWLREGPASGRFGPPLVAAAALLGLLVASAAEAARTRPRLSARAIVAAASLAGFAFSLAVLGLEPAGALRTLVVRTMSFSWTSYYTVAVSPEASDPRAFLARHAALLPRLPKHAATHPPGPVLYYRGLIALAESSPRLTAALLELQGHDEAQDPRPPHTRASKAAALLGPLLLTLIGAAAAWPVAAIAARLSGDALAGARVGVLWTLLPGAALFIPQFDQALAFPVAGYAALLLSAAADGRARGRYAKAALAGLLAGIALFVSFGAAAFLVVATLAALAVTGVSRGMLGAGLAAVAVGSGLIGLSAGLGHEPLTALRTALAIHRETYTLPRSYALWLPYNLLDLALFVGPPVALLFACRTTDSRFARASAAGLGLLLLSGATRGEVGRIWIPLMPFVLVGALARPATEGEEASPSRGTALLLGTLLAALDIVLRLRWQL